MKKELTEAGVNLKTAASLGLLRLNRSGDYYDFFSQRLIIPLTNSRGQTIAFMGRVLNQKNARVGKYINSPTNVNYKKSRHIFGLFEAQEAIRRQKRVLIVEGNLDVVSGHQFGYPETVAISGTALSFDHLNQLSRLSSNLYLAFDGDAAGQRATIKSLINVLKANLNLNIVQLPANSDPDQLLQKNPAVFKKLVDQAPTGLDWYYQICRKQFDLTTAQGKKSFSNRICKILTLVKDEVEISHYLNQLAVDCQTEIELLKKKLARLIVKTPTQPVAAKLAPKTEVDPPEVGLKTPEQAIFLERLLGHLLIEARLRPICRDDSQLAHIFSQNRRFQACYFQLIEFSERIVDGQKLPDSLKPFQKLIETALANFWGPLASMIDQTKLDSEINLFDDQSSFNNLRQQLISLNTKKEKIKAASLS